jgi:SAM-dependent methyltransferase
VASFQDAFGHVLYDYLHGDGGGAYSIIERDDGFVDVDDPKHYFAGYEEWPPHQQQAMDYACGRVLDIGCGAGRHALYLQERGLDVLGIDQSPLAVRVCRLRGLKQAQVLPITRVSSRLGTFDTLLMLGNNFGLFGRVRRTRWLLKRFRGLTSAQARVIVESLDPYRTDDPVHLEYHQWNRSRGRSGGQVRIRVRYRKRVDPWFDYLFVSKSEMEQLLDGSGWTVERYLDSDGAVYAAIIRKVAPK